LGPSPSVFPSFFAFRALAVKKWVLRAPLETPVGFPKVLDSVDLYTLALFFSFSLPGQKHLLFHQG
jgi:hypothetical protein